MLPQVEVIGMPLTRSEQMARIHGRDTSPERVLRSLLWQGGLRYRIHHSTQCGRPDLVFLRRRLAVFVDGCFWHGCPDHYVRPRTQTEFWSHKLASNVERDRRQTLELEGLGWAVLRVWEHEIAEHPDQVVEIIRTALHDAQWAGRDDWRVYRVDAIDEQSGAEQRFLQKLRDSNARIVMEGPRRTTKWRRPGRTARRSGKRAD